MEDPTRPTGSTRDVDDDTSAGPGGRSRPGRPRWVKVALIIVIVAAVLLVILARAGVFGGGGGLQGPSHGAPGVGASPATA
jgi:hypothetical protein